MRKLIVLCFTINTILAVVPSTSWSIPSEGHHIMMSGPSLYAIEAGRKISESGGNVVDVAVAMGLTLAVTSPYYAALGGGGFALIKMKGKVEVLDFREVAPLATHAEYYSKNKKNSSQEGGSAVGVPGFPAGLFALHKKYGKLHWSSLFATPIKLAQKGFRVTGEWARLTRRAHKRFNRGGRKAFIKKNGDLYKPGEIIKQKALAKVLKEMRNRNITSFYQGIVAKDIVDTVKKAGGVLSLKDLKNYQVKWREPLKAQFMGHQIYLMPPPSSGGIVIKTALQLMEILNLPQYTPLSVDELHILAEVLNRSFRGRAMLGDPDFHKNPLEHLLSKKYIKELADSIDLKKVTHLEPLAEPTGKKETANTTHFAVMDAKGHAVSLTTTLNGNYGSAVVTQRFGIALNNEMDDFTTHPGKPNMFGLVQGRGNYVQAGKRPLSSMSPTLVEKNGRIVLALGAPGGPRIISSVLQTLYRVLASGYDMDRAIQTLRVHNQFLPRKLFVDKGFVPPAILKGLTERGHVIEPSWWIGKVYGVRKNKEGYLEAAFDSRGEGAAGGY